MHKSCKVTIGLVDLAKASPGVNVTPDDAPIVGYTTPFGVDYALVGVF
jgi:hypothetical protein